MKFLANRATSFQVSSHSHSGGPPFDSSSAARVSLETMDIVRECVPCFAIQALPGREGRIEPPLVRGIPIQRSWGQPENQAR